MIPALNEEGYLPPGVYQATLDEVIARFGRGSEQREAQAQSLEWLAPLCRDAGVVRLVVNGSFVTSIAEPNDVDCLLFAGPAYDADSPAARLITAGLPFISVQIVFTQEDWDQFVGIIYGTDRRMMPKGVVEVRL
jgi:hypothetical protein